MKDKFRSGSYEKHDRLTDDSGERRYFSEESVWNSTESGWQSLHLRRYDHEPEVEELDTPASTDQVIVLVTSGSTLIESCSAGRWRSAAHLPGSIGMTAPGESNRLRWRGPERHQTLHLHLPVALIAEAALDAAESRSAFSGRASRLSVSDDVIGSVMISLARAAEGGASDLYAASAAHFLARHLIARHVGTEPEAPIGSGAARMRRIEDYMNAYLATNVTLHDLAAVARCTSFQLIRLCKAHWKQTPFQRLTQLRMDAARHLLRTTDASVISIAMDCGYTNPSHFAIAFRRNVGVSPSEYRGR